MQQAARILGISRQAVEAAIKRGTLPAEEGYPRRVRLSHVIVYGLRRGQSAEALMEQAEKELKETPDWGTLAVLVLGLLGALVLVNFVQNKRGSPENRREKRNTQMIKS